MQISTSSESRFTRPVFAVYRGEWPRALAASIAQYQEPGALSVALQRFLDTSASYFLTPLPGVSTESDATGRTRNRKSVGRTRRHK
jgi:hypothetical protein